MDHLTHNDETNHNILAYFICRDQAVDEFFEFHIVVCLTVLSPDEWSISSHKYLRDFFAKAFNWSLIH